MTLAALTWPHNCMKTTQKNITNITLLCISKMCNISLSQKCRINPINSKALRNILKMIQECYAHQTQLEFGGSFFIEAISNGSHIKTFNLQKTFNLRKSSTNKKYSTYEKHQTYKNHLGYQKHGKCPTYKEHSTNEKYWTY